MNTLREFYLRNYIEAESKSFLADEKVIIGYFNCSDSCRGYTYIQKSIKQTIMNWLKR